MLCLLGLSGETGSTYDLTSITATLPSTKSEPFSPPKKRIRRRKPSSADLGTPAKLLQQLKSPKKKNKKKVTVDDSSVIIEMIVSSVGLCASWDS